MLKEQKNSRRRFLSFSLLTGAGLIVNSIEAHTNPVPTDTDGPIVKMLTPDGQLVEVDEGLLAQMRQGNKASNQDILNWSTVQHESKEKF